MISTVFFIEGNVPSKKNQRQTFYKNGRIINIPSKRYLEWHDQAMNQLQALKIPEFKPPYKITLSFWFKDNRPKDMDNAAQSILDLLQDYGVIENDKWQCIQELHLYSHGIDKNLPRVKVDISSEIE